MHEKFKLVKHDSLVNMGSKFKISLFVIAELYMGFCIPMQMFSQISTHAQASTSLADLINHFINSKSYRPQFHVHVFL